MIRHGILETSRKKAASGPAWPTDGLIDRWSFNDNATGMNSISFETVSAGISYATGLLTGNKAIVGDGNDYIQTTNSTFINTIKTRNTFSISFWFKPTVHTDPGTFLYITDNNLHCYTNADGYYYDNTAHINTNQTWSSSYWRHYVFYYDGTNYGVYTDSTYRNQASSATSLTPAYFRLGAHTGGSSGIKGSITLLYLYNKKLSDSEISQLYNGGAGV